MVKGGVVFVGPLNNKASILRALLEKNKLAYDRIIFIDDKAHHVQSMESEFGHTGDENANKFVGFRYGAADAAVKDFDPAIGQLQWDYLIRQRKVISDEEARKILSSTRQ